MSWSRTAPVATIRPSATSGEEAARRSIAPSISTCSAPWASIASLTARTSAAALGPATSIAPAGLEPTRAISTLPSGVRTPGSSSSSCGDAARAQQRVGGRDEAARGQAHTRLFDAASITSCSSPSRPTEVTPTRRPAGFQLAQQRGQRLGLAGVLRQADERETLGRCRQLAEHRRVRPGRPAPPVQPAPHAPPARAR